jgi:hypothetical protein
MYQSLSINQSLIEDEELLSFDVLTDGENVNLIFARCKLCVPAASATSERSFSISDLFIAPLRNNISESNARITAKHACNEKWNKHFKGSNLIPNHGDLE